ncbi:MAG: 5-methyltetrahydropteroyltriglutamate--homocysteine S-methyltransferase [Rhodospirillales bacterium]|nr:5-methyltetrahydropteroyltriglutamate--homocysteine S-methyltransferase [Rhodospirillales bacterium]
MGGSASGRSPMSATLAPPAPARTRPPFRADHVGSLLRPKRLAEARAAHRAGTLDAAGLRAVEDGCIADAIARQEAVGLRAATDGEYRRAYWHYDFVAGLEGVELYEPEQKIEFKGATLPHALRVSGPIRHTHPIMVEDFRFLAAHVKTAMPKQTIPSPSVVHFRGGRAAIDQAAYPDLDRFFADLGAAYRGAIGDFAAAGCRYLQLDEVYIAYLCDPAQIEGLKARGEHAEGLLDRYADLINYAIGARPADMTISMHLCRGNFRSTWVASGGYEPVAETLFNKIEADAYFMEYDSDRAGGFEPLRFVPRGRKIVVLGLITSKSGALETKDELKRRIEAASKYLPLEQLALSPQCGFASTEEGNSLSEEQQWAKLRLCVEVAREVWGSV